MALSTDTKCGKCNMPLTCKADDIANCDCSSIALSDETRAFLSKTSYGCLCNACLLHFQSLVVQANAVDCKQVVEDTHYYMEGGFMVFTELYHMQRGYCCKSGCRHCVYGFKS
jgi:Family of unknown function (DUF5522)/Cysteine-rich CWC